MLPVRLLQVTIGTTCFSKTFPTSERTVFIPRKWHPLLSYRYLASYAIISTDATYLRFSPPLCGIGDKHRFFDCQKLHGPQILDTIGPECLSLFNQDKLPKLIAAEALEELSSYWNPYETLTSIRRFMRQPARFPELLKLRTYVTRITLGVHIKQAMTLGRMQRDWANSKFYDEILSEQSDILDDLTNCSFLKAFHIQIWDYDPQQHKAEQLLSRIVPRIERLCELLVGRLGDGLVIKVLARRKKTTSGQYNQYKSVLEWFTRRPLAIYGFQSINGCI